MKGKTIILLISIALVGLFLSEINDVVGNWSWGGTSSCIDSDGTNIYTKGKVTRAGMTYWDSCYKGNVMERQCYFGSLLIYPYTCPSGQTCKDGKCVIIPTQETLTQETISEETSPTQETLTTKEPTSDTTK